MGLGLSLSIARRLENIAKVDALNIRDSAPYLGADCHPSDVMPSRGAAAAVYGLKVEV